MCEAAACEEGELPGAASSLQPNIRTEAQANPSVCISYARAREAAFKSSLYCDIAKLPGQGTVSICSDVPGANQAEGLDPFVCCDDDDVPPSVDTNPLHVLSYMCMYI